MSKPTMFLLNNEKQIKKFEQLNKKHQEEDDYKIQCVDQFEDKLTPEQRVAKMIERQLIYGN